MIMPRRFKGEPLFTAVQSELFDTDIEELGPELTSAARFSSPPDPRGARAGIRCVQDPCKAHTLQGSLAFWSARGI